MKYAALTGVLSIAMMFGIAATPNSVIPEEIGIQDNGANVAESPHQVQANVEVMKNGEKLLEKSNVMLDGERIIRQQVTGNTLGTDGKNASTFNTIALGSGTESNAFSSSDSTLASDGSRYGLNGQGYTHASGLEPTEATYTNLEGESQGKWEIEHTFTAGELADVSQTAIEIDGQTTSSTSGPFIDNTNSNTFAATSFGRSIPLETDDKLTVTWEVIPQNN